MSRALKHVMNLDMLVLPLSLCGMSRYWGSVARLLGNPLPPAYGRRILQGVGQPTVRSKP